MKKDLQFNSEIWANSLQTIKLTKGSKIFFFFFYITMNSHTRG